MRYWVNSEANQQPEGLELPYRGYRIFNVGTNTIKEFDGEKWIDYATLSVGDEIAILDKGTVIILTSQKEA